MNVGRRKCVARVFFGLLALLSIHSWWYIYTVNKRSHFLMFFAGTGSECHVHYPQNGSLDVRSTYWQALNSSGGAIYIFGAYLDVRNASNKLVRFTTIVGRLEPHVRLYAQLWYRPHGPRASFTPKCELRLMWHLKWGTKGAEYPFLVSCTLRDHVDVQLIESVSLVENICDRAANRLAVRPTAAGRTKHDFGVCVKGLNLRDAGRTVRLIEWIELMHLLGAHKIYFYELSVHPQIKALLEYYTRNDKVEVVPASLSNPAHGTDLLAKRHNEMIVYNDCFYRNHGQYNYLALLDIDEVIVPTTVNTWRELFTILTPRFKGDVFPTINSICIRNIYFLDEFRGGTGRWFRGIPPHMHTLQHVYRQRNFSREGFYAKCFHSTQNSIILHNHFAFACVRRKCLYHHLDVRLAQLNHYRSHCHRGNALQCDGGKKQVVADFGMWKYKVDLIGNVDKVLCDLKLNGSIKALG